jgi:hypothetical protein
MKALLFACFVAVTAVACAAGGCGTSSSATPGAGSSGTGTSGGTGTDGGIPAGDGGAGGIGLDGGEAPLGSFNVTFGPIDAPPGEEHTKCVVKRLGNPSAIHVGSVHNVLSLGSHHMIVYRVNDTVEQTTPFDCKPFTDTLDPTKGSALMISQKEDDALVLPDGVAYTLDVNQMVRLEMHYINAGAAVKSIKGTSTFIPIEQAKFKYEADFLFVGTPDISIPAKSSATVGPVFISLPAAYANVNFFAITGHEHQWGTNVVVSTATSQTDPGTPVYNVPNWLWSEPATVKADPPFKLPANGGFNLTCTWNNMSDATVKFGESVNSEMCFFWAYYYPSQGGAKVCIHTDKYGPSVNACCPDSSQPVCSAIASQF